MFPRKLVYFNTFILQHEGECSIIGLMSDSRLLVEESYSDGEEDFFAQHILSASGAIEQSVDEDFGRRGDVHPFVVPEGTIKPRQPTSTRWLNYSGPRWRGLRDEERVRDMVLSLSMADKMQLMKHPGLQFPAMLLGLGESTVLSEVVFAPGQYLICRRLRLVYALPEPQHDPSIGRYDYDSHVLHVAQFVTDNDDIPSGITDALAGPGDKPLNRPVDCLHHDNRLYIADGGGAGGVNTVHVFTVESA